MNSYRQRFFFCPKCGSPLQLNSVHGRQRLQCVGCGYVLYENPVVGVAVILVDDTGRVLLGRRSENSTYPGTWCIPCGYVEYDEEVRAAAAREFFEETGLHVSLHEVVTVLSNFHNPETHTVGIWFRGERIGGNLQAGDDLDRVDWFSPAAPPMLAFPSDQIVLAMLANFVQGRTPEN